MKRIKEIKLPLLCLAIFAVLYTTVVFIIGGVVSKRGVDGAFITTYAMMFIALSIYCYSLFVGISDKPGAVIAVNGPGVVAFIYLVFTFIMTTILYFIDYNANMVYVMIFYLFFVFIFLMFYVPALHHISILKQQPKKLPKVKKVEDLIDKISSLSLLERAEKLRIDEKRAKVIVCGAYLLKCIMKEFNIQEITVSEGDNILGYLKKKVFGEGYER